MSWVCDALTEHGGEARIVDVARLIWAHHEAELRTSNDLFYTWQYDMRWAAKRLRDEGKVAAPEASPRGTWALKR
jgi:hypothetical protein